MHHTSKTNWSKKKVKLRNPFILHFNFRLRDEYNGRGYNIKSHTSIGLRVSKDKMGEHVCRVKALKHVSHLHLSTQKRRSA